MIPKSPPVASDDHGGRTRLAYIDSSPGRVDPNLSKCPPSSAEVIQDRTRPAVYEMLTKDLHKILFLRNKA